MGDPASASDTALTDEPAAPSLDAVMAYDNRDVVARYEDKLGLSRSEAETLFLDTKRFLYLCATAAVGYVPPPKVDAGWHEFILFTADYEAFCFDFFGHFVHHEPRRLGDTSTDGPTLHDTVAAAEALFGSLSPNWRQKGRSAVHLVEQFPSFLKVAGDR